MSSSEFAQVRLGCNAAAERASYFAHYFRCRKWPADRAARYPAAMPRPNNPNWQPMVAASVKARRQRVLDRLERGIKRCPRCGEDLPLSVFCATSRKGEGNSSYCRPCSIEVLTERKRLVRGRAWEPADDAAAASDSLSVVKKRRASSWQSGLPNIPQLPSPPDLTPKMIALDVC